MSATDLKQEASKGGNIFRPAALILLELCLLLIISFAFTVSLLEFFGKPGNIILGPGAYSMDLSPRIQKSGGEQIGGDKHSMKHWIFFANGSASVSNESTVMLSYLSLNLKCDAAKVRVVPWVSSAQFLRDRDGKRNVALANARGLAVRDLVLKANKSMAVDTYEWASFDDLRKKLTYNDERNSALIASPMEPFNRRVDVEITEGCLDP